MNYRAVIKGDQLQAAQPFKYGKRIRALQRLVLKSSVNLLHKLQMSRYTLSKTVQKFLDMFRYSTYFSCATSLMRPLMIPLPSSMSSFCIPATTALVKAGPNLFEPRIPTLHFFVKILGI